MADPDPKACGFDRIAHTADIGVRVRGRSLEELFIHAAQALFEVMLELPQRPGAATRAPDGETISVTAEDLPTLLQGWLSELLYRFVDEGRVGTGFAIRRLERAAGTCALEAEVRSEPFDPARHVPRTALKAVTFHQLRVEAEPGGTWVAQVFFDV